MAEPRDSALTRPVLYGYWRSSSAYRVRIALNLKNIEADHRPVHLVRDGGEQNSPAYRQVNPLGLVPALQVGGVTVVQSLAICEFLEERFPRPALLPPAAEERARVRAIVQTICSEIQPLNNVSVLGFLRDAMGLDESDRAHWYRHWIERGFRAVETWLCEPGSGRFCHGDRPGLADCFLVPQVYNAERFDCDLAPYPRICEIVGHCRELEAFHLAAPEQQPDAE